MIGKDADRLEEYLKMLVEIESFAREINGAMVIVCNMIDIYCRDGFKIDRSHEKAKSLYEELRRTHYYSGELENLKIRKFLQTNAGIGKFDIYHTNLDLLNETMYNLLWQIDAVGYRMVNWGRFDPPEYSIEDISSFVRHAKNAVELVRDLTTILSSPLSEKDINRIHAIVQDIKDEEKANDFFWFRHLNQFVDFIGREEGFDPKYIGYLPDILRKFEEIADICLYLARFIESFSYLLFHIYKKK